MVFLGLNALWSLGVWFLRASTGFTKKRVTSSQKRRKKPYAQVMVFSQGPLETILHVPKFFAQNLVTFLSFLNMRG